MLGCDRVQHQGCREIFISTSEAVGILQHCTLNEGVGKDGLCIHVQRMCRDSPRTKSELGA